MDNWKVRSPLAKSRLNKFLPKFWLQVNERTYMANQYLIHENHEVIFPPLAINTVPLCSNLSCAKISIMVVPWNQSKKKKIFQGLLEAKIDSITKSGICQKTKHLSKTSFDGYFFIAKVNLLNFFCLISQTDKVAFILLYYSKVKDWIKKHL